MSRLANQHGAVNLGQGFPDFPGPDFVKAAAKAAIDADLNQYALSHGAPRLRAAIADTWQERYGVDIDPDREVTVTSGATEAIYDAIQAFAGAGDEIVVFEPFYDSYLPSAIMAGATLRTITLQPPDWSFDLEEAAAALGPRTRVLLLNTPHNPTGKVFTRSELAILAELCQQWDVVAVTDEVYERIVFDGADHVPLATLPGMWERTLTINSTGKTFSMTGWKIGFAVGPPELNAALRAVHQFVTFASATPFQEAMAIALESAASRGYYDTLAQDYTGAQRPPAIGPRGGGPADIAGERRLFPQGGRLRARIRDGRRLLSLADGRDRRGRRAAVRLLSRSGARSVAGAILLCQAGGDDRDGGGATPARCGGHADVRLSLSRRRGLCATRGPQDLTRTCRARRPRAGSRPFPLVITSPGARTGMPGG